MRDHGYYAHNDDWPPDTSDLDPREVFAALDGLPWDAAMDSLRKDGDDA